MEPFFKTSLGALYCGDALEVLRQLEKRSVDVVITSPPYWQKRDYGPGAERTWEDGWTGQLGLEPTPQMFVDHLVQVFEEVKRVLKPTGSLFVVIDDTWVGGNRGGHREWYGEAEEKMPKVKWPKELKKKSLALVPELFAEKMVYEKGWILREKIVWAKKVHFYSERKTKGNGMPESVKDRFAHEWEYVFHFTLRQRYFFNLDEVRVPFSPLTLKRAEYGWNFENKTKSDEYPRSTKEINAGLAEKIRRSKYLQTGVKTRSPGARALKILAEGREEEKVLVREALTNVNAYLKERLEKSGLNVKKLAELTGIKETQLAHYFRTDLSGAAIPSREVWEVLKPILGLEDYEKHVKEEYRSVLPSPCPLGANPGDVVQINVKPFREAHFAVFPPQIPEMLIKAACPPLVCQKCGKPFFKAEKGWLPSCACGAPSSPGLVLDPFAGSGTTLLAAEKLGRRWIGIEINEEYCEIVKKRMKKELGRVLNSSRLFEALEVRE